jgi:hypothetical protein
VTVSVSLKIADSVGTKPTETASEPPGRRGAGMPETTEAVNTLVVVVTDETVNGHWALPFVTVTESELHTVLTDRRPREVSNDRVRKYLKLQFGHHFIL